MTDRPRKPYVGVTGFMTRAEVDAALDALPDIGRPLMVGVLASSKTIAGPGNSKPRRYPKPGDIAGIFSPDPRCLNLLHYASDTPPDREEVLHLLKVAGPLCHGFQFNLSWPRQGPLKALREAAAVRARELRFVLQVSPKTGEPNPAHYGYVVTDLLLDASGGNRIALDPATVKSSVDDLIQPWSWLTEDCPAVGIAGGLCAETLPDVGPLIQEHGLSFDAEGGLRDDAEGGGNLDLDKVRAYLSAASKLFVGPSSEAIASAARAAVRLVGFDGRLSVHSLAERTLAAELGRALTEAEVALLEAACDAVLSR